MSCGVGLVGGVWQRAGTQIEDLIFLPLDTESPPDTLQLILAQKMFERLLTDPCRKKSPEYSVAEIPMDFKCYGMEKRDAGKIETLFTVEQILQDAGQSALHAIMRASMHL